jgi:hypothetical protein
MPDNPDDGQIGRTRGLQRWPPGEDHIINVPKTVATLGTLMLYKCSAGTQTQKDIDLHIIGHHVPPVNPFQLFLCSFPF